MSKVEIKTPVFPESVVSGVLTVLSKKVGDSVKRYEVIANIETDKVVFEVVAPESGVISEIYAKEQDEVQSNVLLALLDTAAVSIDDPKITDKVEKESPVNSPQVTSRVKHNDETTSEIDLSQFAPSIRRRLRQLSHQELTAYINGDYIISQSKSSAEGISHSAAQIEIDSTLSKPTINKANAPRVATHQPLSPLRKAISQNLLNVKARTAMLTTFNEVDLSELQPIRNKFNQEFEHEFGIKLGYMTFFIKAVSRALEQYPIISSKLIDGQVFKYNTQNIAIAVQTDKGLMAPVIRDVQHQELIEIELSIKELALKANDGQLEIADVQEGDFTISNGGVFGSTLSTPLINGNQSAILGMHAIQQKPVVINGEIVIRPIMNLALSYDHCLIDGKEAVLFLKKIKEYIENPIKLTLGL